MADWSLSDSSLVATPHREVNAALQELLSGARAILGSHFVGMYLDGSLALGDFDLETSDLDFVVVTTPASAFDARRRSC